MNRGAQNLYWKLLRAVAKKKCPSCGPHEVKALMGLQHDFYKMMYNEGKTTVGMSPSAFHKYYEECQRASILMFGVSGMDEDDGEFDHGSTPVN